MSSVKEFLNTLRQSGIRIQKRGDNLQVKAPPEVLTLEMRQQIAERKTDILAFFTDFESSSDALPTIQSASRNQPLPLSFAQERLWFLEQFSPQNPFYNSPLALELQGSLHKDALQQALNELVARHEILRTTVLNEADRLHLQIHPLSEVGVPIEVVDLNTMDSGEEPLKRLLGEKANQPFDLTQEQPLRVTLFKQQADNHVLLLTIHHIATDGWSFGVLMREFSALYNAFVQGQSSPLTPLAIQYIDFTLWQRRWFTGEVLEQQQQYWLRRLAEVPTVLELPADLPRPPIHTYSGARVIRQLSPELTGQLNRFSQQHQTSLFMTTLAAFAIVISHYTRQTNLLIGSPIANRHHQALESLIGFFVNTLALQIDLRESPTFQDLLQQVRQTTLEAYDHQDLPFERLVNALKLERDMSHNPLVQVMFAVQNAPMEPPTLSELTTSLVGLEAQTVRLDLEVHLWEQEGALECHASYYKDIFEAATIERLLAHFETVLTAVVTDASQPVQSYSLLNESEIRQIQMWNDTEGRPPAVGVSQDQTIIDLFEQQVEKTPDAIAVIFEEKQLTYRQLNQKANQLAHYLIEQLNQADGRAAGQPTTPPLSLIGIAVERSLEMVIGVLAILKAGGAYVPIDPSYPTARIQYMLEDSAVPLLLTGGHLTEDGRLVAAPLSAAPPSHEEPSYEWLSHLPHECRVVCLDEGPTEDGGLFHSWSGSPKRPNYSTSFADWSSANPVRQSQAEDLAYVIYTSGSTGKPKGVMIEHAGARNLAVFQQQYFHINSDSRILQFSSLSFDAAVWELLMALCWGAELCVVSRLKIQTELQEILQDQRITHAILPPSVANELSNSHLPDLKCLIVGGEACSADLVIKWAQPGRRFINAYGPTESTVCASVFECVPDGNKPPIGQPITNTRIYILDAHHQLLPPGIPGELCIAGRGLARGYLNRPELTKEKFIEIDIAGTTERIYKTGDLARWKLNIMGSGNLEYLGRIDHQVKLRGFRIELGEIEAVLCQHRFVKDAVLLLTDDNQWLNACLTTEAESDLDATKLKDWLKLQLPDYMIPRRLIILDKLPLTPNGKIDKDALRKVTPLGEAETTPLPKNDANFIGAAEGTFVSDGPQTRLEQQIAEIWTRVLKIDKVGTQDNFFDLGGNSLLLLQVRRRFKSQLDKSITVVELLQYPTIQSLAAHLSNDESKENGLEDCVPQIKPSLDESRDVAIIGMAGHFPGAYNIEEFWDNLREGVESIQFFSDEALLKNGVDPALLSQPGYVKAKGVLDGAERFDAQFFGYAPNEAEILDPQQRLFLEIAWTGIEHAGYDVTRISFPVGVFAGAGMSTYFINHVWPKRMQLEGAGGLHMMLGDKDFIATRTAYQLNLKGPALNLHTACSTSLVAVHVACQSLLNGECEMALAGAVSVSFPQTQGYLYQEGMVMSPDGHCRAFDADARGTLGGAGVGVVVLKPLKRALADGDTIHAVIKGSAINNDGRDKVGFTAPSVDGQISAIIEAMRGLDYESISYVEAHGTGTELGDPIEVNALTQAYRKQTQKKGYCALGSVKTNVGHLDTVAGVASLIKTVLALQHREIPPSLHFKNPNPEIDFVNSPFFVNSELSAWQSPTPLRAGVSSFGIGGTNAHIIVEEAPEQTASESRDWQLLCLSARTETALEQYSLNLAESFSSHPELNLADVAYTLQVGRKNFAHRRAVVCQNTQDAGNVLKMENPGRILTAHTPSVTPPVVFMFSGLGEQYVNMAAGLYQKEPFFRESFDRCASILEPLLKTDLRTIVYDDQAPVPVGQTPEINLRKMMGREEEDSDAVSQRLNQTRYAHPAMFVVEYALAQLWIHWGIRPRAMIGFSLGEYVAACLAGVLSLDDALRAVVKRAELIDRLPAGAMLAVPLPSEEVMPLLDEELSLATMNAPSLCTVAGTELAIQRLEKRLNTKTILYRRLRTTHAFHSKMMEPIQDEFTEFLKSLHFKPPQIPYLSNVTGKLIQDHEAMDPVYWGKHTCQTVRFSEGVQFLSNESNPLFLEVGPGQSLTGFVIQQLGAGTTALASLRNRNEAQADEAYLLNTLGSLWLAGVNIDTQSLYGEEKRLRIPLPTYPFERQTYWIEPQSLPDREPIVAKTQDTMARLDFHDWFYVPTWKRASSLRQWGRCDEPGLPSSAKGRWGQKWQWLVFAEESTSGRQLVNWLKNKNQEVLVVTPGDAFFYDEVGAFVLQPGVLEDYERLILQLKAMDRLPHKIVYLWGLHPLGQDNALGSPLEDLFYSLLNLVKAIGEEGLQEAIQLGIVTNNTQPVTSEENLSPSFVPGLCQVIPQEYRNLTCSAIDFHCSVTDEPWDELKIEQMASEFLRNLPDAIVAYRGHRRWTPTFERIHLEEPATQKTVLRPGGIYLITGGLGGVGLGVAKYLVEHGAIPVLLGRSELPPREEWDTILESNDFDEKQSYRIQKVREMEAIQSDNLLILTADVSHLAEMQSAVAQVLNRYQTIDGVFHVAGNPGNGLIQFKTPPMAEEVIAPKIRGTLVLEEVFKDIPLDFMVLFSSNTSILGEMGQVDYCAANSFLDAYAHYRTFCLNQKTLTVNWDAWQWDSWTKALMKDFPDFYKRLKQDREAYGLSFEEGAKALMWGLSSEEPQVIVSTRDFNQLEEHHRSRSGQESFLEKMLTVKPESKSSRPDLGIPYVPPETDSEVLIIEIWQELLGIEPIGIHDHFFQIGGHSLLGIQLISRLKETFEVTVPLKVLFSAPTVEKLNGVIEELILMEIEGLTDETIGEQLEQLSSDQDPSELWQPQSYVLPNQLKIEHLNKAETDHFYKDIFEDHVYYKHGIYLQPGDVVFDVGANIGLFTLFAHTQCQAITLYSFEPSPPLFQILENNVANHGVNAKLFNCGLSHQPDEAKFTFYPRSSGMSTFYADKDDEIAVLKAIMDNQQRQGMAEMTEVLQHTEDLLEERFQEAEFVCPLKCLSDILAEHQIERVALLKVDVQKSELDVLNGILEPDWDKIHQIVLEIHDIDGRVDHICSLLAEKGYHVRMEQDALYVNSNIFNLYALRPGVRKNI